jgi:hypothetical protein
VNAKWVDIHTHCREGALKDKKETH